MITETPVGTTTKRDTAHPPSKVVALSPKQKAIIGYGKSGNALNVKSFFSVFDNGDHPRYVTANYYALSASHNQICTYAESSYNFNLVGDMRFDYITIAFLLISEFVRDAFAHVRVLLSNSPIGPLLPTLPPPR